MLLSEYDQWAVSKAQSAWQRVVEFHSRELWPSKTPTKQMPPNGLLFHYATAEGFKGIVEKNELWATSAYCQEDPTEITYGVGLLKEALDEWIAKYSRSRESISHRLAEDLQRLFGEERSNVEISVPIFISCFCEEDDLPSQWRKYGDSGGFSLGLRVPPDIFTNQGFMPEPDTFTSKWVKVDYDRNEQAKKCRAILDSLLPIYDDPDTTKAMVAAFFHPLFGYFVIRKTLADILLEEVVGFKRRGYEPEKEWRIVVRRRELTKQGRDNGGKTPPSIYSRSLKGKEVSYVKLIPIRSTDKLPIVCVRPGPTHDKSTEGIAVRMFLEKNGFDNVRVETPDRTVPRAR